MKAYLVDDMQKGLTPITRTRGNSSFNDLGDEFGCIPGDCEE